MTSLYYDSIFLRHVTGDHPENAQRIVPVIRHLTHAALDVPCERPGWSPATETQLLRVHTAEHVDRVRSFAERGGGYIEQDTVVCRESYEVALMAAGAVCDAVQRVAQRLAPNAFCLVRPPGHHALPDAPMGFCLFNNVAVGARVATHECGCQRVLIADFDVHHGNGTQEIFWRDADVGFLSMHRFPFYPGTGAADETGAGPGAGMTHNIPIRYGTPPAQQLARFRKELRAFARRLRPEFVLLSAGFDSHRLDPIGSLGLEADDFADLTLAVCEVADEYAGGRLVSVLEGGYNPVALTDCVRAHLEVLTSS